jgi:catechol 2,3-dioxygenase-like lactoylglutathione lyase family enzyme
MFRLRPFSLEAVSREDGGRREAMPHVRSVLETCLDVDDLEQARRFYATVFDLPVLAGDARFCAMAVSNQNVLILFKRDASKEPIRIPGGIIPPHGSQGPAHFAFGIDMDSVDWWRRRLAEYSIPIYSEVRWPLGGVSLYFHDPDGHVGELATPGVWDFTKLS